MVGHFDVLQDFGSKVVTAFARMRTSTVPFGACGSYAFHATGNLDSPQRVFEFFVTGLKRTWDQKLSSRLLLTFMSTHFRFAATEQYCLVRAMLLGH